MKAPVLFACALAVLPVSALARVSAPKAYSVEALELARVLSHCTAEVAELSKLGPAAMISSASHEEMNDLDRYNIEFEAGGYAPSFHRYSVGTLRISKSFVPSMIHAPDAPGGRIEYQCEIVKP